MGADIIIATLAQKRGTDLQWDALEPALQALTLDHLGTGLEYALGQEFDDLDEAREEVRQIFKDLREITDQINDPNVYSPRDLTVLTVRDLKLYISGGMSWGDMPTDSSEVLDRPCHFPELLQAVGFVTDWWEDD